MSNDLKLIIGLLLGQLMMTLIMVYVIQKKKDISFLPAFTSYVKAEFGLYLIAFVGVLIIMFVLPDILSPNNDGLTPSVIKWKTRVFNNFRIVTVIIGIFSPLLWLLFFKRGVRAIEAKDKEISNA